MIKMMKKFIRRKPAKKKVVKKVRCAATTKDGKRCKRMVTPPAKFCHLHKGWKPSVKKIKRNKDTNDPGPSKPQVGNNDE